MEIAERVLALLGALLAVGGGATACAYWLFSWFGKTWIEQRFAQRLEAFRHEQARDLEQLRFKVNALFNRISRVQDKEFEVLPIAWQKLHEAVGAAFHLIRSVKQYPDLDSMSAEQLTAFLNATDLPDFQKQELRERDKNVEHYAELQYWRDLATAKAKLADFHNFAIVNRIFLSADLWTQFRTADDLMQRALIDYEVGRQAHNGNMMSQGTEAIGKRLGPILEQIERLVQTRLHYDEAL